VINKTENIYYGWIRNENGELKKGLIKQWKVITGLSGNPCIKILSRALFNYNWRKQFHFPWQLNKPEMIVDKVLKNKISGLKQSGYAPKKICSVAKGAGDLQDWNILLDKENMASRVKVNENFNSTYIKCITDTGSGKSFGRIWPHSMKHSWRNHSNIWAGIFLRMASTL